MKATMSKTTKTASQFADRILAQHHSADELYSVMLDKIRAVDFDAMENAIMAEWRPDRLKDENERAMAKEEVCFKLGLELGRRLGGAR